MGKRRPPPSGGVGEEAERAVISVQILLIVLQIFVGLAVGLYFWNLLRRERSGRLTQRQSTGREMEELRRLRAIALSEPLSERTRPASIDEIVGQEEGLKALRAALMGPNPQHVIIYGPPGVGKTAAARLVLEEAKKNPLSPFRADAPFVELDATTARFDERGIADPLIGSVHDPIYQGAGALGQAGVPQPKPGAVTRAHGGVLFIDEIGELHPIQMNKLLKVLEDRLVRLESAYYSPDNPNIPPHIHDIFQNGLPADFRLVGATTRLPEELPPALRSRCVEVYFRPLTEREIETIARRAAGKLGAAVEPGALELLARYAQNGREAVAAVQLAYGVALTEGRRDLRIRDIRWVIDTSRLQPRPKARLPERPEVGRALGLAVYGPSLGAVIDVEATAVPARRPGAGQFTVTGIVEEEALGGRGRTLTRKSLAFGAAETVRTLLGRLGFRVVDHDLHVHFPGGAPLDGPSAGVTVFVALYSALTGRPVDPRTALTGEVSVRGKVLPVGGIRAKLDAAREAGLRRVVVPKANEEARSCEGLEVVFAGTIEEVLAAALLPAPSAPASAPVPEVLDRSAVRREGGYRPAARGTGVADLASPSEEA
ncbi:MAG: ATP-dependent protease La [Hydrogenibacillus schlegelii]|uniref:endopeptidase La n=1 Tax=Hydrogenibacillus schlegelii TaxID=1484 RepID=A0A2T5GB94_HYDSH|nr:MAG: ATP-dependent protease La [Hydrogenibacillus schlegelii]